MLASLSLFGLGIFGPGIATGLVSGAPQLGAGAALGTAGALVGGSGTGRSGCAWGSAARRSRRPGRHPCRKRARWRVQQWPTRLARRRPARAALPVLALGLPALRAPVAGAARQRSQELRRTRRFGRQRQRPGGRDAAFRATGGTEPAPSRPMRTRPARQQPLRPAATPDWARRLRSEQRMRAHAHTTTQAIKEGDRPARGCKPRSRPEGGLMFRRASATLRPNTGTSHALPARRARSGTTASARPASRRKNWRLMSFGSLGLAVLLGRRARSGSRCQSRVDALCRAGR